MIHHIGARGSAMQLALLRSGAGLVLVGFLAWKTGWSVLKTSQLRLQLLRGLVSVSYLWVMMYSFARLPFADATAISYTQAAYIAVFSALILNERATPLQWTAVAIGSIGALFIVKPAFGDRNIVYLIALLGTSFNGLAFVLNKYLQRPGGDFAIDDDVLRQCRRRRLQPSGLGNDSAPRTRRLALAVRRAHIRTRGNVCRPGGDQIRKRLEFLDLTHSYVWLLPLSPAALCFMKFRTCSVGWALPPSC